MPKYAGNIWAIRPECPGIKVSRLLLIYLIRLAPKPYFDLDTIVFICLSQNLAISNKKADAEDIGFFVIYLDIIHICCYRNLYRSGILPGNADWWMSS